MYKKKRILGLIPARGGSKGLPGKNLRLLLGKPLIAWTIERALASDVLDNVVVSTDDKEIAKVALKNGADVPFLRPSSLATDTATSYDVIFHALDYFLQIGTKYDYIALLEPTSPIREKEDIDNAVRLLIDNNQKATSLVSVGKIALENPNYAKKIDKKGRVCSYFEQKKKYIRRQDLPCAYFPYGVIYLSSVKALRKENSFYQKNTIPYYINRWQNYEVDDIYDFNCIEAVLKLTKEKNV